MTIMTIKTQKICTSLLHCLTLVGKCPSPSALLQPLASCRFWNVQDTLPTQGLRTHFLSGTVLARYLNSFFFFSFLPLGLFAQTSLSQKSLPWPTFLQSCWRKSTILNQEILLCSSFFFSTPSLLLVIAHSSLRSWFNHYFLRKTNTE